MRLKLKYDQLFSFSHFSSFLNYQILLFSGDLVGVKRWVEELGRDVNLSDQVYDER